MTENAHASLHIKTCGILSSNFWVSEGWWFQSTYNICSQLTYVISQKLWLMKL